MGALFDTNILIDYLNGLTAAASEFELHEKIAVSIISWMEVLVGASDEQEETAIRGFLADFNLHWIDSEVAELAVRIRRKQSVKLPDAIIWATAKVNGDLLVTRNTRDFGLQDPMIRVPYTVRPNSK